MAGSWLNSNGTPWISSCIASHQQYASSVIDCVWRRLCFSALFLAIVVPLHCYRIASFCMNGELVSIAVFHYHWYFINHWLTTLFLIPRPVLIRTYPPLDLCLPSDALRSPSFSLLPHCYGGISIYLDLLFSFSSLSLFPSSPSFFRCTLFVSGVGLSFHDDPTPLFSLLSL